MSDNRFGVQFNPFAPLPEPEPAAPATGTDLWRQALLDAQPEFAPEPGPFAFIRDFLANQAGYRQARDETFHNAVMSPENREYVWNYLTQMPIRDAMAAGSQAFIDAPGSTLNAAREGFSAGGAYLRENLPDYLQFANMSGDPYIPMEDRPNQPGFADIFAQGREPLPEGVTPEEFQADLMALLANRQGVFGEESGVGAIPPEEFAAKYGMDPSLGVPNMADQANLRYGDPTVPGAIADIAATAVDVFDAATRALGFAGGAMAFARNFGPDDWMAIAAPGSWYRAPKGSRPGTPPQVMDVYNNIVNRYETLGPSRDPLRAAQDIEELFGSMGARVGITYDPVSGMPARGSIAVGDASVSFSFKEWPTPNGDPVPYIDIGTLHTSNPRGRSPHQLAALQPILEIADMNGLPMATYASPFDHRATSITGLENIYNKLGFQYANGGAYDRSGATLVRQPVPMDTTEARAAEYAMRRNPVIEHRARLAHSAPREAEDIQEMVAMLQFYPSGLNPTGGELPLPPALAALTSDSITQGLVDDHVYSLFRIISNGLDDAIAPYRSTRYADSAQDFAEAMNGIQDAAKSYLRQNMTDPDALAYAEQLVDRRVAESLREGRLFDRYAVPAAPARDTGALDRLRAAQGVDDAAADARLAAMSRPPGEVYASLTDRFGAVLPAVPSEPMPRDAFEALTELDSALRAHERGEMSSQVLEGVGRDVRDRLERLLAVPDADDSGRNLYANIYDSNPDSAFYIENLLDNVLTQQGGYLTSVSDPTTFRAANPDFTNINVADDVLFGPGDAGPSAFAQANPEAPQEIVALADSGRYNFSEPSIVDNRMQFEYTMRGTEHWPDVRDEAIVDMNGSRQTALGRPVQYNPDIATPRPIVDDTGTRYAFDLNDGWAQWLDDIATADPDMMYRGMSWEEWQEAQRTGVIRSLGTYNIGDAQQGLTLYAAEPGAAGSYASGFAPQQFAPTPDRPGVVIAVPRRPGVPGAAPTGEIAVADAIPFGEVAHVWEAHPYASTPGRIDAVRDWADPGYRQGSAMPPHNPVAWREAEVPTVATGPSPAAYAPDPVPSMQTTYGVVPQAEDVSSGPLRLRGGGEMFPYSFPDDPTNVAFYAAPIGDSYDTAAVLRAPVSGELPAAAITNRALASGIDPLRAFHGDMVMRATSERNPLKPETVEIYDAINKVLADYANGAIEIADFTAAMDDIATRARSHAISAVFMRNAMPSGVPEVDQASVELLESLAAFALLPYSQMLRYAW